MATPETGLAWWNDEGEKTSTNAAACYRENRHAEEREGRGRVKESLQGHVPSGEQISDQSF